jgi:hypothetical protein
MLFGRSLAATTFAGSSLAMVTATSRRDRLAEAFIKVNAYLITFSGVESGKEVISALIGKDGWTMNHTRFGIQQLVLLLLLFAMRFYSVHRPPRQGKDLGFTNLDGTK